MKAQRFSCLLLGCTMLAASLHARESAHFDSAGVDIHYVTEGQGEAIVLIHGFGGSGGTAWIGPGNFDALADAGFRVIALDNRGHGESGKPHDPADYGVNMAEDVRRLLDHLGIERAHVVGYSMGGKIANTFRARHPGRLLTLTLGGYGWPWRGPDLTLQESRDRLSRREVMPGNDLDALAAYGARSNDLVPAEADLRANRVPTLSIVGTEDATVARDDVRTLRETMANVTAVDMPGTHAGSDGVLYKPAFAAAVIAFIRQNAGTAASAEAR